MVNLTIHARRRLLQAACLALSAGIIAACAGSALLPLEEGPAVVRPAAASRSTEARRKIGSLDSYSSIHSRNLRPVLVETKPPPTAPKLTATLAGTAVEPDYTCAFFRAANGETLTVQVGGRIEGAEVVEVREGAVVLKFGDQTLTLTVERKEGSS